MFLEKKLTPKSGAETFQQIIMVSKDANALSFLLENNQRTMNIMLAIKAKKQEKLTKLKTVGCAAGL